MNRYQTLVSKADRLRETQQTQLVMPGLYTSVVQGGDHRGWIRAWINGDYLGMFPKDDMNAVAVAAKKKLEQG
jgi:hypothetical protein